MSLDLNATFNTYSPKRVSFILPHRNRAELLDRALERCRAFKGPEDELIVMDGASTDHTREVVAKYADLIDVFISEPDIHPASSGISAVHSEFRKDPLNAVNKGFLIARGKYLKTIADDDIYHPEGIKQAVEALEKNTDIDLLICGGTRERFGRVEYVYMPPDTQYGKSITDVFRYGRGCGCGHFFRRSALARVGLHPYTEWKPGTEIMTLHPDAEYVLRFFKSGAKVKFCRINAFHATYSHSNYGVLGLKGADTEQYWREAAQRYCSWWFALWFSLSRRIAKSALGGKLKYMRHLLRQRIKNRAIQRFLGKRVTPAEIIWDGGLS